MLPIIENDTQAYSTGANGEHFWNLAINTMPNVNSSELWSEYDLYITDQLMRDQVFEALQQYSETHSSIYVNELTQGDNSIIRIAWGTV